jgi:hypothetical protein
MTNPASNLLCARITNLNPKAEKIELPKRLSGLTKTHRIIMIEKYKELQFMLLCNQIRFNDFKKHRADRQRDQRREKRRKKVNIDLS